MHTPNILQQRMQIQTRLDTLTIAILKEMLGHYNLPRAGVKATLRARLLALVEEAIAHNNHGRFEDRQYMVMNGGRKPPSSSNSLIMSPTPEVITINSDASEAFEAPGKLFVHLQNICSC